MTHSKSMFFGAAGFLAASLTLGTFGLGAGTAWAAGNGNSSASSNSHAGGNGNAVAGANSNAGGNGNGNGNAGGNGKPGTTAGGANGNAGGNGNAVGKGNAGNAPPGNNGTIKVDEYSGDPGEVIPGPDNDPHVSCGLSINFYGYDSGLRNASITITQVAPTAGGTVYRNTAVPWSNTGPRTSGSQWDATLQIKDSQLALTGAPQAKQGYHLRVEAEVSYAQGSDDKYKVIWYEPCTAMTTPPPVTPKVPPTTKDLSNSAPPVILPVIPPTVASGSSSSGATGTATRTATVAAGSSSAAATPAASASQSVVPVGGLTAPGHSATVPTSGSSPTVGGLAFTGANVAGLVILGLGLIAGGVLLTRRSRRPRTSL